MKTRNVMTHSGEPAESKHNSTDTPLFRTGDVDGDGTSSTHGESPWSFERPSGSTAPPAAAVVRGTLRRRVCRWAALLFLALLTSSLFVVVPLIKQGITRTPSLAVRLVPSDGRHIEFLLPAVWAQGLVGTVCTQLLIDDISVVKSAVGQLTLSALYYTVWYTVLEEGVKVAAVNTTVAAEPVCVEAGDLVAQLSPTRFYTSGALNETGVEGFVDIQQEWQGRVGRRSDLRQVAPSLSKYSIEQVKAGLAGFTFALRGTSEDII